MKELPIACSLSTTDLAGRLGEIAAIGAVALLDGERRGDRHLLRFRPDAGIGRRLEAVVAAEARCCPFLELELTLEDEALALAISAPPGGESAAEGLASAFSTAGDTSGERRLVSSRSDRASAKHEPEGEPDTRRG